MHVYASRLGCVLAVVTLAVVTLAAAPLARAAPPPRKIGVNVVLSTDVSAAALARLSEHGTVRDVLPSIRGVTLQAVETELPAIQALPFVESAEPDVVHAGAPIDTVPVESLGGGGNMWNLDAANLTELGAGRTVSYDGSGVWVAVVDSGLLDSWRQYFPQERIATQFAISFGGGGGNVGTISTQPNKWQHDQASHGTAVTSAILGFRDEVGRTWNGAAPRATVIPVKVLNQNNTAYASVIARGITYVADLKKSRALGDAPVVLNLSVGGGPSALERAAVQYAIESGIIFVAAAGNLGTTTMTYPAAYPEVISVGATGWAGQWGAGGGGWWHLDDVPDPATAQDFFVAPFSSRARTSPPQQLDVLAPGIWIVAPWQVNSGKIDVQYVEGTSFAAPLVAGIAALMVQKNPALGQAQVEAVLTGSALTLPPGCRTVADPVAGSMTTCWSANATGAGIVTADAALAATP